MVTCFVLLATMGSQEQKLEGCADEDLHQHSFDALFEAGNHKVPCVLCI